MSIKDLLWKNWEEWKHGGLSEKTIKNSISKNETEYLNNWITNEFKMQKQTFMDIGIKKIVDIATWSQYGTDSITLLPLNLRENLLEDSAKKFDIPKEVLRLLAINQPLSRGVKC